MTFKTIKDYKITWRSSRERCTWRRWWTSPSGTSLILKALILLGQEGLGLVLRPGKQLHVLLRHSRRQGGVDPLLFTHWDKKEFRTMTKNIVI